MSQQFQRSLAFIVNLRESEMQIKLLNFAIILI